jgi:hypothetical protein
MTVNEYLNKFTQMSRYAPDEVNTDKKKQDLVPTSQHQLLGFPEDG